MQRKIINLFRTDMYVFPTNLDVVELEKYILSIKEKSEGRKISNLGGWQSNDLNLEDMQLRPLCENIKIHVKHYCKYLSLKGQFRLTNMWANINNYKDSNEYHIHDDAIISGVFYVKTSKNHGDLCFHNKDHIGLASWKPKIENYLSQNCANFLVKPQTNSLILFPGWLAHSVKPSYNKEENRISISFNIS